MDRFHKAVVTSVSLSCLLSMDFVPHSKPPPVHKMVECELPRVLGVIARKQRLGGIEIELHRATCDDPADLLRRVTDAIKDLDAATTAVIEHGHEDMVFSVMHYMRKPPTATQERIAKISREVAKTLGVEVPREFDAIVGDAYDAAHSHIVRV